MGYEAMAEEALRQVVQTSLERVLREGLPGEHHFFIAFRTGYPGVEIADSLRETYPDEMTIVLQHRFWNLEVAEDYFEVELTFNNVPQHLHVPYKAIRTFYDPSVEFGLQFQVDEGTPEDTTDTAPVKAVPTEDDTAGSASNEGAEETSTDNTDQAGQVVSLDAFRKK